MMYQALVKRGKCSWFPIGPLCYNHEEAEGYIAYHTKLKAFDKKPEPITMIQEVTSADFYSGR